jgi:hypothetical protein
MAWPPPSASSLAEVRNRLRAFEDRYNAMAQPFPWKFTTTDLDNPPARLDQHALTDGQESSVFLAV